MKFLTQTFILLSLLVSVAQAASLDAYVDASSGTGTVKFVGSNAKFQGLYIYACGYSSSDSCRQENADTVCRRFGFHGANSWSAVSTYEAHLPGDTQIWEPGERGNQIVLNKIKISQIQGNAINSPKIFGAISCEY